MREVNSEKPDIFTIQYTVKIAFLLYDFFSFSCRVVSVGDAICNKVE